MSAEKYYIKGFNSSYILAKHKPILLNKITRSLTPSNNYLQGFFAGKKQHEMENIKEEVVELQQLRYQSHDQEKGFGRNL